MQDLRRVLDPHMRSNPGKIFPTKKSCVETAPAYRAHPIEEKGLAQRF